MGGFSGSVQSVIAQTSGVQVTRTGSTAEVVLATINIPPLQQNSQIRVNFLSSVTNNANTKTLRVRFGGTSGTIYYLNSQTSTVNTQGFVIIRNRGLTNSQVGAPYVLVTGSSAGALVTSSVDTSSASTIVISGQLQSGADSVSLESYTVEVINP